MGGIIECFTQTYVCTIYNIVLIQSPLDSKLRVEKGLMNRTGSGLELYKVHVHTCTCTCVGGDNAQSHTCTCTCIYIFISNRSGLFIIHVHVHKCH